MSATDHRGALAHQFESLDQQRAAGTLGMWIFLATELMLFGGLFAGYAVYRTSWPGEFAAASEHLNALIGAANTAVLITSSLTIVLAVVSCRAGRLRQCAMFLAATILFGSVFLLVKAFEWWTDFHEQLIPGIAFNELVWVEQGVNVRGVKLFFVLYFLMTGLHAVHMTIGLAVLLVLVMMAFRGGVSAERYMPVELTGLYWHFVDVIWIFLFPLFYLIRI